MIPLVRSELLKLGTTRTALGLLVGMVSLIVLITLLNGLVPNLTFVWDRKHQFQLVANGSIASAFAGILGLLSMTTEFRHGTTRATFLAEPNRTRILIAKVLATSAFGVVLGALGVSLSYFLGRICLSARDVPFLLTNSDVRLVFVGAIAATALWGVFGVFLGAVIRNQVGAIVGVLIWVLFVEGIVFGLVPSVGRYLPAQAANVLTQIETPHALSITAGVALFLAYILATGIGGVLVTERRDVP